VDFGGGAPIVYLSILIAGCKNDNIIKIAK
jgi:hypothetical protein